MVQEGQKNIHETIDKNTKDACGVKTKMFKKLLEKSELVIEEFEAIGNIKVKLLVSIWLLFSHTT